MTGTARIALIGDYNVDVPAHRAIPGALEIACAQTGAAVEGVWVETASLGEDVAHQLSGFDGAWCVPASPYANMEGALDAIRFARESGRPFLGTCGGFQHALIEIVRNVAGRTDADHAESNPDAELAVMTPLACSLVEATGEIHLTPGSRLRDVIAAPTVTEGYRCSYGFNTECEALLSGTGVRFVGFDNDGDPRAFELEGHPFFFGTLFQPERSALAQRSHPLVCAFVSAVAQHHAALDT
ncbi:MAG: CTP synthase C-terminal region-related (seleno)protein [Alphaproteobacteria bacterium]|jgi:CTP synthase (UTP-ammonia lyase)